jgi:hypothetical protein
MVCDVDRFERLLRIRGLGCDRELSSTEETDPKKSG